MLRAFRPLLRRLIHVTAVVHFAAIASVANAQRIGTPPLDPRTDVSASGAFALRVEPGTPEGRGGAHYRLEHAGAEVWSAELPFTLWESVVADDGSVAGYAYGNGLEGWSGVRGDGSRGDFRVVILDPAGTPRLNVATERISSRFFHSLDTPVAACVLLDPDGDRFVVCVEDEDLNRQMEEWWPFRLSTGEALPRFRPREHLEDPERARFIIDAQHVKGTPLDLLHWWTFDDETSDGRNVGARFTLMGPDGSPVWTFDRPADYTLPGDEEAEDRLQDEIIRNGAILSCAEPGRFAIGLVADGKRVTFEVTPDAAAPKPWKVVEVARADWAPGQAAVVPPAMAEGHLEQVGAIELGGTSAAGTAFGRIAAFDIDDRGRLGWLREANGKRTFLLVGPDGAVLAEVPVALSLEGGDKSVAAEWLAADRWLLSVRWPAGGNENPAWWLDVGTQRVEAIPDLRLPAIRSIDGDGHGGFVALTSLQQEFSSEEEIVAIDASGRTRWTLAADYQDEKKPLSPEAVAVAPDGSVGVLDVIRKVVLVYAPDGTHAATIDLEQSWGREPTYPSELAAEGNGGWIVGDFQGETPLVRMSPRGEIVAALVPRLLVGRKVDPIGRFVAAPDSGLWITDQHALLHLDGEGIVDRVAGHAPDPDHLDALAGIVVDPLGRILAGDLRTGAVHVFDGEGRRLFVCRPSPQDAQGCEQIAGAPDGRIFAGGAMGFVCYSERGERTGTTAKLLDPAADMGVSEQWLFQPQGGKRWVRDLVYLALADADGTAARRIEKRPDGTWLELPREACMAPDGSVAVISESLCLYGPDGEPRQMIALPEGTDYAPMAFDGRRILLATDEAIYVRELSSSAWKRHAFASKFPGFRAIFLAPDGERIRLVTYDTPRILEFRLSE